MNPDLLLPMAWQIAFGVVLMACMGALLVRFILGPTNLDRAMIVDAIALVFLCLIGVMAASVGTGFFFEAILVLSIVGYLSTVALAKFIEKGRLFDE